jgi:hypothetical protein
MGSEKSAGPISPAGPLRVGAEQPNFKLLDLKVAAAAEVPDAVRFCGGLYGRSQTGRGKPLIDAGSCFSLPGLPKLCFSHRARWQQYGFLAQTLCLIGETLFERLRLSETAALCHALLHSVREGGSAMGVLITDRHQKPRDDS